MSNKIVPNTYRTIIDDVITSMKPEFDEYGVSEDILAELQNKWQAKLLASGVAEFDPVQPTHAPAAHAYPPPHALAMMPAAHPHYPPSHNPYAPPQQAGPSGVKPEPVVDPRYMIPYMPVLAGPSVPGARPPGGPPAVLPFPQGGRPPAGAQLAGVPPQRGAQGQSQRIPQVDGPSSSGSDGSPEPAQYAPRTSHPSLPQPSQATQSSQNDDEAINSDLDDSDDEEVEDEATAAQNNRETVFCTYDKVARVRNKWKCVLKDGLIHINGKDYLFAKCTGEFEW